MGEIDSPRGAGGRPGEVRVVTRALWGIARDVADDRVLAERICRACVEGLDIDGAAISLFTVRTTAKPCSPPTRPPCCSKICSSASVRVPVWTRLPAGARCGRDLYRVAPGPLSGSQQRDAISAADAAALMLLDLRTDPGDITAWDRSWSTRAEKWRRDETTGYMHYA
jgi:hypothetical protein